MKQTIPTPSDAVRMAMRAAGSDRTAFIAELVSNPSCSLRAACSAAAMLHLDDVVTIADLMLATTAPRPMQNGHRRRPSSATSKRSHTVDSEQRKRLTRPRQPAGGWSGRTLADRGLLHARILWEMRNGDEHSISAIAKRMGARTSVVGSAIRALLSAARVTYNGRMTKGARYRLA